MSFLRVRAVPASTDLTLRTERRPCQRTLGQCGELADDGLDARGRIRMHI